MKTLILLIALIVSDFSLAEHEQNSNRLIIDQYGLPGCLFDVTGNYYLRFSWHEDYLRDQVIQAQMYGRRSLSRYTDDLNGKNHCVYRKFPSVSRMHKNLKKKVTQYRFPLPVGVKVIKKTFHHKTLLTSREVEVTFDLPEEAQSDFKFIQKPNLKSTLIAKPGAPKLYVFLTLGNDEGRPFWRTSSWNINKHLEKYIKKKFKDSNWQVEMIHRATVFDLNEVTKRNEVSGILWLSHATSGRSGEGIGFAAKITDSNGTDVQDVLKNIPPNLRFLSIVGCNTYELFKTWRKDGVFDHNSNLLVLSFNRPITPKAGIGFSRIYLENGDTVDRNRFCVERQGYALNVQLKEPNQNEKMFLNFKAGGVDLGNILNTDINNAPGKVYFTTSTFDSALDLKFVVNSNISVNGVEREFKLGQVRFSSVNGVDFKGNWKIVAKRDGTPIGITKHIYKFDGDPATVSLPLESYKPFNCKELDPYFTKELMENVVHFVEFTEK